MVQNFQQPVVHYTFLTFVIIELPECVPIARASVDNVTSAHFQSCEGDDQDIGQGTELVMPQFKFHPIHRIYVYYDGVVPAQTIVVVEINLPSVVRPGIYILEIVDERSLLQLEV